MNTITQSCVLLLWMHTLSFITCQECTLEDFIKGPMYDSNFETTSLEATYQSKDQVRVACAVGYSGFFKLICNNGQWQSRGTNCEPASGCQRPPHLSGGDTKFSTKHTYEHNDRVEYICQNHYKMEGEPYKTCKNGQWTGDMKCLKPCIVDRELMNKHNVMFLYRRDNKLYSAHDDTIQFLCVRGTTHDGVLDMRQRCIDGTIDLPTCH
ncbi:complement factor H like 5 [Entelurus aequoreus]|uniref:complement factor H like 5 n=1 Tax=Entelurus aequoreus TaxID=161455 RepID=UPI002B1E8629|nr:complement factor H like 5 [Entelurus aequoreus]XP_061884507.1 complement factor H like 5 [Entelurus aequoreus]